MPLLLIKYLPLSFSPQPLIDFFLQEVADFFIASLVGDMRHAEMMSAQHLRIPDVILAAFADWHNVVDLDIKRAVRLVKTIVAVIKYVARSESVTGLSRPTFIAGSGFDQMYGLLRQNGGAFRQ